MKQLVLRYAGQIWLSVWCALGTACTTMTIPDYPGPPAEKMSQGQASGELTVTVYPMLGSDELGDYFDVNLVSENILALFIKVKNNSPAKSFAIFRDHVSLGGLDASDASALLDRVATTTAGETVMTVGAVCILVFLPLYVVLLPTGANMISNATVRRHNFVIKGLKTTTLSPGQETQGFAYFSLPEGGLTPDLCIARLRVMDLSSGDWQEFACPFKYEAR